MCARREHGAQAGKAGAGGLVRKTLPGSAPQRWERRAVPPDGKLSAIMSCAQKCVALVKADRNEAAARDSFPLLPGLGAAQRL